MTDNRPATGGQSGQASGFGGIAGLFGEDDELKPRYYSDPINRMANTYAGLLKPRELKPLNAAYTAAYRANDPLALENAGFYGEQARGILGDNTRGIDTFERLRSGNFSALADQFKNIMDYGLSSVKAREAAGGYGGSGPSIYSQIANSNLAASNIGPRIDTIFNNLGRDTMGLVGGDRTWDSYRMGQFAQDPLTGYSDTATAGRVYQPLNAYRNSINANTGSLSNILNGVIIPNVAGYDLEAGLGTRLNNLSSGIQNDIGFAANLYGQVYGGGMAGGMGGGGGGGGMPSMGGGGGGGGGMQISPQMIQQMMQMYGGGVGMNPNAGYSPTNFYGYPAGTNA